MKVKRSFIENKAIEICRWANGHECCDCHNLNRERICLEAELFSKRLFDSFESYLRSK